MLGDDLLREGNADPAIKCWFTVKGKEQLTFIERSRVEIPATDFDHHMAMVGGSGNGEFTTTLHAPYGGLDYGTEAFLDKMPIQFYFGYPITQFSSELDTRVMKFVAQLIEDPGEDCIYISWHLVQANSLEPVQNSIDRRFQAGYLLKNNLKVGTIGIALRHPALEQTGKTTDRGKWIPDLVGHPQRHVVEDFDPLCEYELIF